jgi:hypothetical protein
MPLIPFPDVPDTSGVPAIPRLPTAAEVTPILISGIQGALWRAFQVNQQWGIWTLSADGTKPIKLLADPSLFPGFVGVAVQSIGGLLPGNLVGSATLSTGSLDYSKEMKVSDFPIERGGFASYNKVEMPANPVMVLYFSGTTSERQKFINEIDRACKSQELFAIVTPEVNYIGYTMEKYAYRRAQDKGAYMYVVEVPLREIREVTSQYTISNRGNVESPKDAGAVPPVDNGKTQTAAPTQSTARSLTDKIIDLVIGS